MKKQLLVILFANGVLPLIVLAQPKLESIGNQSIRRVFALKEAARTFEIDNVVSNNEFAVAGEEFKLDLEIDEEKREVLASNCKLESTDKKDGHLTLVFKEPGLGLTGNDNNVRSSGRIGQVATSHRLAGLAQRHVQSRNREVQQSRIRAASDGHLRPDR